MFALSFKFDLCRGLFLSVDFFSLMDSLFSIVKLNFCLAVQVSCSTIVGRNGITLCRTSPASSSCKLKFKLYDVALPEKFEL